MKLFPRGRADWMRVLVLWGAPILMLVAVGFIMIKMPGQSYSMPLLPLSGEETEIQERLREHVQILAGEIGERNFWSYEALEASADYIEKIFTQSGYTVLTQRYEVEGKTVRNVEVELLGIRRPEEIVVVGAHYDSVLGSPGANDNATGTATVLELARLLQTRQLSRTVRFVAFVNEEPPFFLTGQMGSRMYAKRARERGEEIIGMISIETIGHYSEQAGSQHYPFPFNFFYPKTANFIGFVGNLASRELVRQSLASFRRHTAFPSEGIAAPGWITGIGWSDQWSFWREGFRGMMITDTALFRYAYYHTQADTPDKIDYARMARVVAGLSRVMVDLAEPTPVSHQPVTD